MFALKYCCLFPSGSTERIVPLSSVQRTNSPLSRQRTSRRKRRIRNLIWAEEVSDNSGMTSTFRSCAGDKFRSHHLTNFTYVRRLLGNEKDVYGRTVRSRDLICMSRNEAALPAEVRTWSHGVLKTMGRRAIRCHSRIEVKLAGFLLILHKSLLRNLKWDILTFQ